MYNRYDSTKGCYVTYDYQPKGDRFNRGLATLSHVWTTVSRYQTGRGFIRYTRTSEAQSLTVGQVKELLSPDVAARLEQVTRYLKLGSVDLLMNWVVRKGHDRGQTEG